MSYTNLNRLFQPLFVFRSVHLRSCLSGGAALLDANIRQVHKILKMTGDGTEIMTTLDVKLGSNAITGKIGIFFTNITLKHQS